MEHMNNWFNDKEHPENMEKKKFLKEIFKIAKHQERYKAGQIGKFSIVSSKFLQAHNLIRWNRPLQCYVWRQTGG